MAANNETSNSTAGRAPNKKQQEALELMQSLAGVPAVPAAAAASAQPQERVTSTGSNFSSTSFNTSELLQKHLFHSGSDNSETGRMIEEMLKSGGASTATPIPMNFNNTNGFTDRQLLERFPSIGSIGIGNLSRNVSGMSAAEAALRTSDLLRSNDSNLFHSGSWAPQLLQSHEDVDYRTVFPPPTAGPVTRQRSGNANAAATTEQKPPAAAAKAKTAPTAAKHAPVAAAAAKPAPAVPRKQAPKRKRSSSVLTRNYIQDSVSDVDVLMGRGGRTNHHKGNENYLQIKERIQPRYLAAAKEDKTAISQELVDAILLQGGRFLKLDALTERWYVVDNQVARKKASQTLREINTPAVRAAKRAKYNKKKQQH